jgi:hypothetical protein
MKAFPNVTNEKGMDLRDYFAAQAMQSFVIVYKDSIPVGQPMQDMAERAYLYADAMMKARAEQ